MSQEKLKLAFGMSKQIPEPTARELFLVKTPGDAWAQTFRLAGRPIKQLAAEIGINRTTLSKVFTNERTMPDQYRSKAYRACGNKFFLHWEVFQEQGRIVAREITPEEELHQLRQENARLAELAQRSA